jgi:glyoxylase-like metal-dependent hydrolase (beta-lactamase superfamily II)
MSSLKSFALPSLLGSVCAVLLASCSSTTAPAANSTTTPTNTTTPFAGLWQHPEDPRVWAWVSAPWTFSTTSYAIEGDDGLVLVDTQFLSTDAAAFVDAVEGATGKKAKVAVVLHANPDKFNGTATLQARGIRVVTSSAVAALLLSVHEKRVAAFADRYGDAYPRALAAPDVFDDGGAVGGDVVVGAEAGVRITLRATGAGCSGAHVLASFESDRGRHVFVGDLLANGSHLWLELGEVGAWRARLDEIAAIDARFVHPGRGLSGGPELIDDARAYLDVVDGAVAAAADADDAKDAVVAAFPGRRFAVFLGIGLPTLMARKAAAAPARTPD